MTPLTLEHSALVHRLFKPGEAIRTSLTDIDCELLHAAMGISGEAGELLDSIKKSVIYRKPIDIENLREELGDLEFFMQALRNLIGVSREETLEHNIIKLQARYPSGYSNLSAVERLDKLS